MMRRPTNNGCKDNPFVRERTIRIIADRIAEIVRVARRVGEIIFSIIFMHPGGLEETAIMFAGGNHRSIFIQNHDPPRLFRKLKHIVAQFDYAGRQSRFIIYRFMPTLDGLIVAVALKLPPQSPPKYI